MLQNINLDAVKQYNASLKQYKDKAATLNAEIEYTNKELDSLCAELTSELGVEVTRDNIEQIYNEQVAKINSTLQSGNAILAKIASEEQSVSMNTVQAVQPSTPVATPVSQPVQTPVTPVAPSPVMTQPTAPTPVAGSIFNGQSAPLPGQSDLSSLPPLFSM